ncbi:S-layer homology domain-containing protein [Paenibacillus montanisoli]|uniref:S-layer homology domain-containing protein n=1 Tax=Paenibacillus montanisoli TaxID=2081970 RepID=A0A328TZ08_9BACL|nr:S-layer homology domain-containing protein [Paenibacillus montanisoli]RAP75758.1 S-layer homology domain-containing protein [Paenibacillus montanisoli]
MNKTKQQAAKIAMAVVIGGGALLPFHTPASEASASVAKAGSTIQQAVDKLAKQGILQGTGDGKLHEERQVTNAEFIKMAVLALGLELDQTEAPSPQSKWYDAYVNAAIKGGLLQGDAAFHPNKQAEGSELAPIIAKALQRDVKSVQYWMQTLQIGQHKITRGEAARLLVFAQQAVRSESASIVSVKALNKITLEVKFDRPMTLGDETTAAAQANMMLSNGLKLVNQPRLKTGSIATYIVPVQTMKSGEVFSLTYKGKQTFSVTSGEEAIRLKDVRQVTGDTFEVSSSREEGVIDYGYVISAYAGGRGANAIVLEEDNSYNGKPLQIISSLASRQAVLTPEGGMPITVNYVGFTQSTDGKQEPKFRLPAGISLQPGVSYTVTSDWFELENNKFTAQQTEPLVIASAANIDGASISLSLSADPGDELFAYRSVQLEGNDGSMLNAQYRVQTRKAGTGIFDILNGGKLAAGVTYEVSPIGTWATAHGIEIDVK